MFRHLRVKDLKLEVLRIWIEVPCLGPRTGHTVGTSMTSSNVHLENHGTQVYCILVARGIFYVATVLYPVRIRA